mmetsp:Transcript_50768/g.91173  ORF Transcript_50768/g.91173 Transcript_50768/m.91173 type:complete len:83 (+) Transcript_50768:293-541(+)
MGDEDGLSMGSRPNGGRLARLLSPIEGDEEGREGTFLPGSPRELVRVEGREEGPDAGPDTRPSPCEGGLVVGVELLPPPSKP